jgi:glycosyltransferase involved in cell wall biosynthesis
LQKQKRLKYTKAFVGEDEMKLVVMIPAYNEEKSIGSVIKEIPRKINGIDIVEVLLIDDGSTDSTIERAIQGGINKVISHKENQGLGAAFKDGLNSALEMNADIMVNIDADGQYNAAEIPELIAPIVENKADIVLGWRDIGGLEFMPRGKKIGNKIATWVTGRLSGLPIKDAQSGFRAFSKEAALRLNLLGRYTYVQETIIQASCKNITIAQVPIEFRPREGKSKLISSLASYMFRAGLIISRTYRDYKILEPAILISGLLFIIGLVFAILVGIHFLATGMITPHILSAILALVFLTLSIQTLLIGFAADMFRSQRLLDEEILYLLKKQRAEKRAERQCSQD